MMRQTSNPSMSGSITSRMTASNAVALERGEPLAPGEGAIDDEPGGAEIVATMAASRASSSMMRSRSAMALDPQMPPGS